ncbi:MAG: ATP-dependent DNA helicase [Halobacteriaceae archaeon]
MRFFPYADTYENQGAAMERIEEALEAGRNVLFEGACGTGKTLSALAPALAFADRTDRTVVITTNVHQQARQFVEEARAIREAEPIQSVVFRGKASMCHVDVGYEECQVLRENTRDLVEVERELADLQRRSEDLLAAAREGDEEAAEARAGLMAEVETLQAERDELAEAAVCDHYRQNLTADASDFFAWLHRGVRTPDEIYEYAARQGYCGYELLKEGLEDVDLVVCNYHHLLDPTIRRQFFRWLDRDPDEVVAVFDEAHNVADAARDHATRTLTEQTLDSAVDELVEETDDPRAAGARNVIEAFRAALVAVREDAVGFGDREAVGDDWVDVTVANDDRRDDLTLSFLDRYEGPGIEADVERALSVGADLDAAYEEAYRRGESDTREECATLAAADFVETWIEEGDAVGAYPVVGLRRDGSTDEVYARAELYRCIPRPVTADLFDDVYANVLMSATLRPFPVARKELGLTDPAELAYGLTFPEANRQTYAVDTPALFAARRDDRDVVETVADALADFARYTPGNVLLFFPSYAEADRYEPELADRLDRRVRGDEAGTPADELREAFVAGDREVLCTSLWGTLTEGVSFDGDDARAVGVVGVPYPRLDERTEAIQAAYAATFDGRRAEDPGWRYAVEIPTVRKTRQALGRVLRAPDEVGVRALFDRRYTTTGRSEMPDYCVRDAFPDEERAELVDVDPGKLRYAVWNFFGDHDAYDGDTPSPD